MNSYNHLVHTVPFCLFSADFYTCTVVPALGDPRREWPPAVCGLVINVQTHLNVTLPAIGGHLPNADADSHLLVVRTCYNGHCKQMPRFGGHFNPKSLAARSLSCDQQFAQISILPSSDRKQYFISRINACVMNHVIVASQTTRRKSRVFCI